MLQLIALAACVVGYVFLGPKALAEFRHAFQKSRTSSSNAPEGKALPDKPKPSAAA
jgi:hypothetical protein